MTQLVKEAEEGLQGEAAESTVEESASGVGSTHGDSDVPSEKEAMAADHSGEWRRKEMCNV